MKFQYLILFVLLLASCNNNGQKESQNSTANEPVNEKKDDIIRKSIPFIGDFISINNMGTINIVYTQGPSNIEVEGPKLLVDLVKVTVDSGVLLINMSNERNVEVQAFQGARSNITAYVSSPSLNVIAVCSSGNFTTNKITTDKMHIGSLDKGSIKIDSLECDYLKFEVNNIGKSHIGWAKIATDCLLVSSGDGSLDISDIEVNGTLTLDDITNSSIVVNGKTANLEINNQGSGLCEFNGTYKSKSIATGGKATVVVNGLKESKN